MLFCLVMNLQGQIITCARIMEVQRLLRENPDWHRTRVSQELCRHWDWRNTNGQLKDMACRSLLLKLERLGHIILPRRRRQSHNANRNRGLLSVEHATLPIDCDLDELLPLSFYPIADKGDDNLFNRLLGRYHYLGYRETVGENLKYLVRDRSGRALACMLFGSAAWKCQVRDYFIGWDEQTRKDHLCFLTNNSRFLVLPWVDVRCLASHILGGISRRLSADWISKYGHPIYFLETFVERDRFKGTCYRAANWRCLGSTQGRSRNDRYHQMNVPLKDVYIYPLIKKFRWNCPHVF